ncbi:hypothetical protein LEP1GSC062_1985 [Leptospira alexanderi serovar Manhao 3 str. L 60]|uniref:Uncharacterized protein n=1 Tax=Leptospira alexanderi serovar Manhao 3 str. L 60 TaxID=1049759 RepID=V6ICQ8_9LEPT|nr:hypothetical protein LEP1GSC062_1985 [Leptospira alexanderi serovar Manhao 3 str. L 60]
MDCFRNSDTGETDSYHARRRNFGHSLSQRIFPGGKVSFFVPFFQSRFFSPRENYYKLNLIYKLEVDLEA